MKLMNGAARRTRAVDLTPVESDGLIPAVAYLRMSSEQQDTSIAQQRQEIIEYARLRGYGIIREYVDEGKSGSKDQEKRVAFQRLLADSCKGEFKAVLCWNTNRFTREDNIDSAFPKQVLRQNNVYLDSVKEGIRDWRTAEGRIIDAVVAEQNHKYSKDLSESSTRGKNDAFNEGKLPHGSIPFGYMRRYYNETTEVFVKRVDSFRKPRKWQVDVLVDEEEAKVVRIIFQVFAERDLSYCQMLKVLEAKGLQTPDGTPWSWSSVRYILTNKAYIGVCEVGASKFSAHKPGKFAQVKKGAKTGIIPAIIDIKTFEIVQDKLATRKDERSIPHGDAYSPLCGIVYCGKCGACMSRATQTKPGKKYYYYKCCSYHKQPSTGCRGWAVRDNEIIPRVVEKLIHELDCDLLKHVQAMPEQEAISDLTILEQQAKALEAKIKTAHERYLTAPPNMMAGLEKTIAGWQADLEDVQDRIRIFQATRNQTGMGALLTWWEETKDKILSLRGEYPIEGAASVKDMTTSMLEWGERRGKAEEVFKVCAENFLLAEADKFREFLHRIGCRVVLFFRPREGKSRCARHRRRQWAKDGRGPRHTYFEVDWERSRIGVNFTWDAEGFSVCAAGGLNGRRRRRPARRRSRSSR